MPNLLEEAKKSNKVTFYEITPEVVELALAWAKDEISFGQAKKGLNITENNKGYSILARALKEYIQKKPTIE